MVCWALTALCVVFLSWPSSYRLKCRTVNGRAFEPNHAGEAQSRRRIEVLERNVRRITLRSAKNPIAIYYEQPRWFQPVFDELERRGVPYVHLDATRHHFGLVPNGNQQFGSVFNRMSPTIHPRSPRVHRAGRNTWLQVPVSHVSSTCVAGKTGRQHR